MDVEAYARLSPCTYADVLTRDRVVDPAIRPLWSPMPRIAGPAYPVACPAGDNLMLHVAIHRAPPGSVIVCAAGDSNWAMAGGNVCAYAQQRGIAGFVVDGAIRDIAETRSNRFPVFGRGVNGLQLFWDGKRYWVASVVWDDERKGNPIPASLLP